MRTVPTVLAVLLPTTCPVCGAAGPAPCPACRRALRPAPPVPAPPGVDRVVAVLAYEGAGRELVARTKYRNRRAAVPWLAAAMAALVAAGEVDVVTWVPTTPARRRQRGFDQAELLARRVARRLGRPCRSLLSRRPGPAQTGLALADRRSAPRLVARSRAAWWGGPAVPLGGRVLLVDDVVTSGATVTAAALALRRAGAARVVAVAAARTPAPARPPPA